MILLNNINENRSSNLVTFGGGSINLIVRGDDFGGGTVTFQVRSKNDISKRFSTIASFTSDGIEKILSVVPGLEFKAVLSDSISPSNVFVETVGSSAEIVISEDPDLKVLLDAQVPSSIFTTGGGGVFKWEDQSGNGNDATQSVVASQPTVGTSFSKPGILFDTNDDFMTLPFTLDWTNQPFTVVAVATKLTNTGFRGIISQRNSNGSGAWWTLGQRSPSSMVVERTGGNNALNFSFNSISQPPQIYEFSHNPSSGRDQVYLNGTLKTDTTTLNIGGLAQILRIGTWVFATQAWDGFLMEIQVRTGLFDAGKRATNFAELSAKWQ